MQQAETRQQNYNLSAGRRSVKTRINKLQTDTSAKHGKSRGNGQHQNVGDYERFASLAAGAGLMLLGLSRRNVPGFLMAAAGSAIAYRGATGHCAIYESLGVDTSKGLISSITEPIDVSQSLSINASPETLYQFWRDLAQLPRVLTHIESIRVLDDRRSHWVAKPVSSLPGKVEWDAEITEDIPNSRIAWKTLPGSTIESQGRIEFKKALGDRGTAVKVSMKYAPPGGSASHLLAKLLGKSPQNLIRQDIRNLKRHIELGEVLTTEGQPYGSCMAKREESPQ